MEALSSAERNQKRPKHVMEKRRRARINASLTELKRLLPYRRAKERSKNVRIEKADILERAVEHLKLLRTTLQHEEYSTWCEHASVTRHERVYSYSQGYKQCLQDVDQYLLRMRLDDKQLRAQVLMHLASRNAGLHVEAEIDFSRSADGVSRTSTNPPVAEATEGELRLAVSSGQLEKLERTAALFRSKKPMSEFSSEDTVVQQTERRSLSLPSCRYAWTNGPEQASSQADSTTPDSVIIHQSPRFSGVNKQEATCKTSPSSAESLVKDDEKGRRVLQCRDSGAEEAELDKAGSHFRGSSEDRSDIYEESCGEDDVFPEEICFGSNEMQKQRVQIPASLEAKTGSRSLSAADMASVRSFSSTVSSPSSSALLERRSSSFLAFGSPSTASASYYGPSPAAIYARRLGADEVSIHPGPPSHHNVNNVSKTLRADRLTRRESASLLVSHLLAEPLRFPTPPLKSSEQPKAHGKLSRRRRAFSASLASETSGSVPLTGVDFSTDVPSDFISGKAKGSINITSDSIKGKAKGSIRHEQLTEARTGSLFSAAHDASNRLCGLERSIDADQASDTRNAADSLADGRCLAPYFERAGRGDRSFSVDDAMDTHTAEMMALGPRYVTAPARWARAVREDDSPTCCGQEGGFPCTAWQEEPCDLSVKRVPEETNPEQSAIQDASIVWRPW